MTPWPAAHQASLSSTIFQSLLKFMLIELVMLSNHLILCCPLLLLPSIFPSSRVVSNESALRIRWPKCCSFSFSPSNEYSGLIIKAEMPPPSESKVLLGKGMWMEYRLRTPLQEALWHYPGGRVWSSSGQPEMNIK